MAKSPNTSRLSKRKAGKTDPVYMELPYNLKTMKKRFGTANKWSLEDVLYLLEELRFGHWNDCGDFFRGFTVATGGLHAALAVDLFGCGTLGYKVALNGIWLAASFMARDAEDERIQDIAATIRELTEWTTKEDLPLKWEREPHPETRAPA